jgi:hypothetical protein
MRNAYTAELQIAHTGSGVGQPDTWTNNFSTGLHVTELTRSYTSAAAVLKLRDLSKDQDLMTIDTQAAQDGLHPDLLGGDGPEPLLLSRPWYIPPGGKVRLFSTNSSGAANTIRVNLHGFLSNEGRAEQGIPYWLGFYRSLAGNGVGTPPGRIPAGCKFIAESIARAATSTAATFRLKLQGKGYLSNNPLLLSACAGEKGLPFRLPAPLEIRAESLVEVELADLSGSTNAIWFALFGWLRRG